jgi:hypothetical protein
MFYNTQGEIIQKKIENFGNTSNDNSLLIHYFFNINNVYNSFYVYNLINGKKETENSAVGILPSDKNKQKIISPILNYVKTFPSNFNFANENSTNNSDNVLSCTDSFLLGSNGYTLAFWIYSSPVNIKVNSFFIALLCKNLGAYHKLISIKSDFSNNRFILTDFGNGYNGDNFFGLEIEKWYHLVIIFDRLNSITKYYINDKLIKKVKLNKNYKSKDLESTISIGGNKNIFLQDVRIYNYGLDSSEISKIYNNGNGLL